MFKSKTHAFYLPRDDRVNLMGIHTSELAIACADVCRRYEFRIVRPDDGEVKDVGRSNWSRQVHDIMVGKIFNPPGNWSSYLPHRHNVDMIPIESDMEEIYHYRIEPETGFGAQFIYSWILAGEKRILMPYDDPKHVWIKMENRSLISEK